MNYKTIYQKAYRRGYRKGFAAGKRLGYNTAWMLPALGYTIGKRFKGLKL